MLEDLEGKKLARSNILSAKAEELTALFNELDDALTAEQVARRTPFLPPSSPLYDIIPRE